MPLINFSGIASGIDTESLIKATSDAARQGREVPLQNKVKDLTDTNDSLGKVKSTLLSLYTMSRKWATLTSNGAVLAKRASSSAEQYVTATATGAAANGRFTISNITSLAAAATFSSYNDTSAGGTDYAYPSASTALNSNIVGGPFDIAVAIGQGSDLQSFNISVSNTTTLNDFVSQFNAATTRAVATVTNVGTTTAPDYRVVITGQDTGLSKGQIIITVPTQIRDPDSVPNSGDERWNNNTLSQAANASFDITGIGTVTRSSNTVSDIIPGLTLTLKDEGGPTTITITDDASGTAAKIREFVNKYNELIAYMQENNQIERIENGTSVANKFHPLALTKIDENSVAAIRNAISGSAYLNTGSAITATNAVRLFADLGVTTDASGYNSETKTGGGTLKFDESVFNTALADEPESVNKILVKFGDLAGVTAGAIDLFAGPGRIVDNAVTNNKQQIDDLNKRVSNAEALILKNETAMRAQFAAMERQIGNLQSQQQRLSSALSSLPRY